MMAAEEATSPLKAAGLGYVARGLHIIPLHHVANGACSCGDASCSSPGKHPIPKNGLHGALSSAEDVDYFWDLYPNANIGIVCGPSKLAVVDLDSEDAELRYRSVVGNPPTPLAAVQTGKGWHLYYADETGAIRPSVGTGPDAGIDLRAGASYVVAPPSIHHTGRVYTWSRALPDEPLSPLPLMVAGYFAKRSRSTQGTESAGGRIGQGARDHTLTSLAGSMRKRGMTEPELFAALRRTNADRCDPPLDERDVRRIARSVAGYEAGSPLLRDVERDGVTPDEHEHEKAARGSSWDPVDLLEAMRNPPPPPSIGGVLYRGMRHVISGEPETGKSWLMLLWCLEQTRAGENVIYVDYEMGPSMTGERLLTLGATPEDIARFTYLGPNESITYAERLDALVDEKRPSLIVIDAMTTSLYMHGLDPNKAADIEAWDHIVQDRLRRSGAAIATLDHVAKSVESRGKFAIGSERKIGICEVHISLTTIHPFGRGREGSAKLTVQKDRSGHLPRPTLGIFRLTSTGISSHASFERHSEDDAPFRPTVLMERVSRFLEAGGPATQTVIERNVQGKAEGIRKAVAVLLAEHYLDNDTSSSSWRRVISVKPFRESDDA